MYSMSKLKYTFKNDILFKMVFVKYPELLKRLVADLLKIRFESIEEFVITNPEMAPENIGRKFCRLDINMIVNNQRVDLEIQVGNEGDYPERSVFYWAREYSTAIAEGDSYTKLPRTIAISILGFTLFACDEYYSEFELREVTRNTRLTDKMSMQYYELAKLPRWVNPQTGLELWLTLFNCETEEDLARLENLEEPIMEKAIGAYRQVSATAEFLEIERLRSKARHDEAQALENARRKAYRKAEEKWQSVIADKDSVIANKDSVIADKDAENEQLRRQLAELQAKLGN